jgi:hypothetical protein
MGNRQELSLDLLRLPVNFGSQLCACVLGMDMEFGIIWRIICWPTDLLQLEDIFSGFSVFHHYREFNAVQGFRPCLSLFMIRFLFWCSLLIPYDFFLYLLSLIKQDLIHMMYRHNKTHTILLLSAQTLESKKYEFRSYCAMSHEANYLSFISTFISKVLLVTACISKDWFRIKWYLAHNVL